MIVNYRVDHTEILVDSNLQKKKTQRNIQLEKIVYLKKIKNKFVRTIKLWRIHKVVLSKGGQVRATIKICKHCPSLVVLNHLGEIM